MAAIAVISARGGSKGVPRKNVRTLHGHPLIAYAICCARACPTVDRVVVNTDDDEITEVSCKYGAEVPFKRPAELASDTASVWSVWQHFVDVMKMADDDILMEVCTTSPLRLLTDLNQLMEKIQDRATEFVITIREAQRNPYYNMVKEAEDGVYEIVIPAERGFHRRQDTPAVFDMTTVAYAMRAGVVRTRSGIFQNRVNAVVIPAERSLDIDSEWDFEVAELAMSKLKLDYPVKLA